MPDEIPVPLLAAPGPVHVAPERWRAVRPMHHRTGEYRRLHLDVSRLAGEAIGTTRAVHIVTASGTGAMEAAVANLVDRDERLLAVSCGKFGDRWGEIGKALGCGTTVVRSPRECGKRARTRSPSRTSNPPPACWYRRPPSSTR